MDTNHVEELKRNHPAFNALSLVIDNSLNLTHQSQPLPAQSLRQVLSSTVLDAIDIQIVPDRKGIIHPLPDNLFLKLVGPWKDIVVQEERFPSGPEGNISNLAIRGANILKLNSTYQNLSLSSFGQHASLRSGVLGRLPTSLSDRPDETEVPDLFALSWGSSFAVKEPKGHCYWRCLDMFQFRINAAHGLEGDTNKPSVLMGAPSDIMGALVLTAPCVAGCPSMESTLPRQGFTKGRQTKDDSKESFGSHTLYELQHPDPTRRRAQNSSDETTQGSIFDEPYPRAQQSSEDTTTTTPLNEEQYQEITQRRYIPRVMEDISRSTILGELTRRRKAGRRSALYTSEEGTASTLSSPSFEISNPLGLSLTRRMSSPALSFRPVDELKRRSLFAHENVHERHLYASELAALTRILRHQTAYNAEIATRIAIGDNEGPGPRYDRTFLVTDDLTAILISLTTTDVRVVEATLQHHTPPHDQPHKPKMVIRVIDQFRYKAENREGFVDGCSSGGTRTR